ncbi:hypothetical protein GUITHDRAFT_104010 [Guillardia theta CCMP2712]|uniref:Cell division control protein 73 C-terminal domain-containing protein n=1 Tax=Guillardia theta (strain CCMP2712) TaxID=905079 RepID=L1JP06_GUITC|nr:hypothetical protein GUITHDRAFT_104010 [Guillardia theta CCMP2712]EKX50197.1 hypothetical protein GUITHDRAFT_104010 [Guillardia theta CCMP2712]|eukprot:XP_005837177.1 hypothetical protein GUITHDRAFT_104010 [Guillardia theta CCMP2712]
MSDPLSILREHIIQKKSISHDENTVFLGDLKFPRSTTTKYKQDRGRGDPYTLEALYFLHLKQHLAGATNARAYNEESSKLGFAKVLLADQRDALAYLTGKQETSENLVSAEDISSIAPGSQPVKASERVPEKRPRDEPQLNLSDENMVAAKKKFAERVDALVLRPIENTKESRTLVEDEKQEAFSSPFVRADAAVTRTLIEQERVHTSLKTFANCAPGKELKSLKDFVGSAYSKSSRAVNGAKAAMPGSNAQPTRRDRYNVDAPDAYKAAGMDQMLLKAEQRKGTSLLATSQPAKSTAQLSSNRPTRWEPIIVVPQAQSSLINKWNAKILLEEGKYRSKEDVRKSGADPDSLATVTHMEDQEMQRYRIVDNVDALGGEEWNRIVAVFVQGSDWQFKNPKWNSIGGNITGLFNRVSGFHLIYSKDPEQPNIKKWNVKKLTIDRNLRHLDAQAMNQFWETLKHNNRLSSQVGVGLRSCVES